jgi:hypothetical protein
MKKKTWRYLLPTEKLQEGDACLNCEYRWDINCIVSTCAGNFASECGRIAIRGKFDDDENFEPKENEKAFLLMLLEKKMAEEENEEEPVQF